MANKNDKLVLRTGDAPACVEHKVVSELPLNSVCTSLPPLYSWESQSANIPEVNWLWPHWLPRDHLKNNLSDESASPVDSHRFWGIMAYFNVLAD